MATSTIEMSQPVVTEDYQLNFLNCYFCKKIISVGPAYSNGSKNICGRCNLDTVVTGSTSEYQRHHMLEQVLINVLFPCTYFDKGCKKRTKWNEDHERVCKYRCVKCPMSYKEKFNLPSKCKWYSNGSLLTEHLQQYHKENFEDLSELILTGEDKIFFAHMGDQEQVCTVVVLFTDPDKYHISLTVPGTKEEIEQYWFQFEIFSKDKQASIVLRQAPVESVYNISRLSRDHTNMLVVTTSTVEGIKADFKNLNCKMSIVKRSNNKREADNVIESSRSKLSKHQEPNMDLLSELECPVCNEYMVPPIFQCSAGHSFCGICNLKLKNCPSCRSLLGYIRNYQLEKITKKIYYPCKNRSEGCNFVTTSDLIRKHEEECQQSRNQCILKCSWKGTLEEMIGHFRIAHATNVLKTGIIYVQEINSGVADPYFAIVHDGQIFRFSIKNMIGQKVIKFTMQHLRPLCVDDRKADFKYTVEFIDANDTGVELHMTYLCQNVTQKPKTAFNDCITVPRDQLKAFLKNNSIQYKISIKRIR